MRAYVIVGALILAACSSSGSDPARSPSPGDAETAGKASPPPPVDPCSLVTKAEVEAATGRKTMDPLSEKLGELMSCVYGDSEDPAARMGAIGTPALNLNVYVGATPEAAQGVLEIARTNAASVEPVVGLGDAAYWDKILRSLRVTRGPYQLDLTVASNAGGLEAVKTLAQHAVARLPVIPVPAPQ